MRKQGLLQEADHALESATEARMCHSLLESACVESSNQGSSLLL